MGKKYNFDSEMCGDKDLAESKQNFEKDNLPYHQLEKIFELYMQLTALNKLKFILE